MLVWCSDLLWQPFGTALKVILLWIMLGGWSPVMNVILGAAKTLFVLIILLR